MVHGALTMTTTKKHNIILTGFMGSGKSRIGVLLSERLKLKLYDIDALIEQSEGMSIAQLFAEKGEWYFRALEYSHIKNLAHLNNAIIVCGGGTPTFFEAAQELKNLGQIFFLDANFALLMKRVKKSSKRPLVTMSNPEQTERLKELYRFRLPLYKNGAHVIDVNHEDRERTCQEISEIFRATQSIASIPTIPINDSVHPYSIFIEEGVARDYKRIISSLGLSNYRPVLVTSDALLHTLKAPLEKIFKAQIHLVTIKDGEKHKNASSVEHIHEQLLSIGCTRQTLIIALGGGTVGDVAGFAAATFMRGIPFIQMPTTLLAMVDSSIGGKTGIDTNLGKNLVGAFYNPQAVIIDHSFLKSLPKEELACGMAEVIKHAIIADPDFFRDLLSNLSLPSLIERALKVKAEIVFQDPSEKSIRAHLNLGHTFAHAIEKESAYAIKHGEAVAMGLVLATELAFKRGILIEDFRPALKSLLKKYHLPEAMPSSLDKTRLLEAMLHDKKRDNKGLRFILPTKLGEVGIFYIDEREVF